MKTPLLLTIFLAFSIAISAQHSNLLFNPDCPVAAADTASGVMNEWITINVGANDFDPNGDEFEVFDIKNNSYLNELDSIMFDQHNIYIKPAPVSERHKVIEYQIRKVNDTTCMSDWTLVHIYLEPNPNLPHIVNDTFSLPAGFAEDIYPLANDNMQGLDSMGIVLLNLLEGVGMILYDGEKINVTGATSYTELDTLRLRYVVGDTNIAFDPYNLLGMGYICITFQNQYSYDVLDINNIRAGFNSYGGKFSKIWDIEDHLTVYIEQAFEFPPDSGKHVFFVDEFWIGGLDENDSLHLAGTRYISQGRDYQPGPVSDFYDESYKRDWIGLWKLSKADIEYHKIHYNDWGYIPHKDIASWPGNGDPSFGQAEQLAPYFDYNQNEIYDPMNGDYPLIRGDQAIFYMFNDDRIHTETGSAPIITEVHGMAYAFDLSEDSVLNNTIFVHYDIYNRSENTYHETWMGHFSDFEIGDAWDDYTGCDVQRGMYYCYNGDDYDGSGEPGHYGANPPAVGVVVLAGPFMDADNLDNPSGQCDYSVNGFNFGNDIVDDERLGLTNLMNTYNSGGPTGDPMIGIEYYRNMQSLWKDGSPLMYAGGGPEARFSYPWNSDTCNWGTNGVLPEGGFNQNGLYWTEETMQNPPADRRGIGSMGPFTFKPGDKQELDMAYVVARGSGDRLNSLEKLLVYVDTLRDKAINGNILIPGNELSINNPSRQDLEIKLYPNPTSSQLTIQIADEPQEEVHFELFDLLGKPVMKGKLLSNKSTLNIEGLEYGIYFLTIKTSSSFQTLKFVKR